MNRRTFAKSVVATLATVAGVCGLKRAAAKPTFTTIVPLRKLTFNVTSHASPSCVRVTVMGFGHDGTPYLISGDPEGMKLQPGDRLMLNTGPA